MTERQIYLTTVKLTLEELGALQLPYEEFLYYMRNNIYIYINSLVVVRWAKFNEKYKVVKEKVKVVEMELCPACENCDSAWYHQDCQCCGGKGEIPKTK
jgi:hypothetical protein